MKQRVQHILDWELLKELVKALPVRMREHQVQIVAGGLAFYFFLAFFPAIAAIISIYSLFTDVSELQSHLQSTAGLLPVKAQEVVRERLSALIEDTTEQKTWSVVLGTFISLWISNVGTRALFKAVNIAYGISERRKSLVEIGLTLVFTIGGVLFYSIAVLLSFTYPVLAEKLHLGGPLETVFEWLKWPVLTAVLTLALTTIYRVAPGSNRQKVPKLFWGAGIAAILWVVGSFILSFFMRNLGVAPSYGTLAAVAMLMLWFLLSSFVIILGAEINAALAGILKSSKGNEE